MFARAWGIAGVSIGAVLCGSAGCGNSSGSDQQPIACLAQQLVVLLQLLRVHAVRWGPFSAHDSVWVHMCMWIVAGYRLGVWMFSVSMCCYVPEKGAGEATEEAPCMLFLPWPLLDMA